MGKRILNLYADNAVQDLLGQLKETSLINFFEQIELFLFNFFEHHL
jgi:hypothetical protein